MTVSTTWNRQTLPFPQYLSNMIILFVAPPLIFFKFHLFESLSKNSVPLLLQYFWNDILLSIQTRPNKKLLKKDLFKLYFRNAKITECNCFARTRVLFTILFYLESVHVLVFQRFGQITVNFWELRLARRAVCFHCHCSEQLLWYWFRQSFENHCIQNWKYTVKSHTAPRMSSSRTFSTSVQAST